MAFLERVKKENYNYHKLPAKYGIDYAITHGDMKQIECVIECKRRHKLSTNGSTILSLHKIWSACNFMDTNDLPFILAFEFDDGLKWISVKNKNTVEYKRLISHPRLVISGRTDRGDPDDIEPCICIPRELWKDLPEET